MGLIFSACVTKPPRSFVPPQAQAEAKRAECSGKEAGPALDSPLAAGRFSLDGLIFRVVAQPSDGNCQFSSMGYHLGLSPRQVRSQVVEHLRSFGEDYEPFLDRCQFPSLEHYCRFMAQDQVWGDHLSLQAAASRFEAHFLVYDTKRSLCVRVSPKSATSRDLAYVLTYDGSHYNAATPCPLSSRVYQG